MTGRNLQIRPVREVVHIFTHIRMTLHVVHVLVDAANYEDLTILKDNSTFLTVEEARHLGLCTMVSKVL